MSIIKKIFSGNLSHVIFWGYNLIYLIFIVLIVLNILGSTFGTRPSLTEILTFGGAFPTNLLVMIYGFILTPFITMGLGYFTKLRKEPQNLIKLFFGFEIPLMGLMLIRIIFLREVSPVVWLFFLGIFLSVVGLLVHMFRPNIRSKIKLTLLMLSQQIALVVAGYAFLLAFFFLPVIVAFMLKDSIGIRYIFRGLFDTLFSVGLLQFLLYLFFILIFLLTVSFFTLGPIGAVIVFWSNCRSLYKRLVDDFGLNYSRLARYGASGLYILVIILLSIQVNANSYANIITSYRNANTFEDRQQIAKQIIDRQNEIRGGLTSSYLAQYRYLSDEKMNLLQQGYKNELGTSESTAQSIQQLFNSLALPFIYRGAFEEDIKQSSENYKELFDNSIQKGELDTILKTLQSTNTQDTLKAGILDASKKTVKLVSRTVKVTSQNDGLLATVSVEEEYENISSRDPQEVYYEFSLPDNAVITELKLGPDLEIGANAADKPVSSQTPVSQSPQPQSSINPTPTPAKIDNAVVAPKGAAGTTYERQIFRRTDPALLAQVGPQQYKLRIFPIPAKGWTLEGRPTTLPQKNQKVRYSYITQVSSQGVPLPSISEQRNVFIDGGTKITHSINGKDNYIPTNTAGDPRFITLQQPLPCSTNTFESQTAAGTVIFIPHSVNPALSRFYTCQNGFSQANRTISGQHIALLLDTSYSNDQKDLSKYLNENFPVLTLLRNNTVDLYYFNDKISRGMPLTEEVLNKGLQVINLGKTDRAGAIASLPQNYNLILMVTDDSIFDAKPEGKTILTNAPIYIIEPQGKIPPYNDVLTNAVVQSNGEVVESGTEAVNNYWQMLQLGSLNQIGTIMDTNELGTWVLLNKGGQDAFLASLKPQVVDSQSPLNLLAQKRVIMESMREAGQSITSLDFLDKIHQMSQQSFIVSPYSSMIVLVTEEQKRQLAEAAKQNNRYQLDLDTGEEQLGDPSGKGILEIGAVPEPHEWLLMITGFFLLVYLYRGRVMMVLQPVYESYRRKIKNT